MKKNVEKELREEVIALRSEIKQLRGVVNVLLEMVMEQEDDDYQIELGYSAIDGNTNLRMGM